MEYYSAMNKDILLFLTTWTALMLSEISQTKTLCSQCICSPICRIQKARPPENRMVVAMC